jgi:hypothetical protein
MSMKNTIQNIYVTNTAVAKAFNLHASSQLHFVFIPSRPFDVVPVVRNADGRTTKTPTVSLSIIMNYFSRLNTMIGARELSSATGGLVVLFSGLEAIS